QRSNGRIHQAVITQINYEAKSVTVEWQEKNEGKGKEVDLDAIVQLNPNLFTSVTNPSSSHNNNNNNNGATVDHDTNNNGDHYTNGGTVTQPNRRTKQQTTDSENVRKQSQLPVAAAVAAVRPAVISSSAVQVNNDISPQKQQTPTIPPVLDSNKSKVVKEIERIAANREQRRARQDERRQKLSEVDQSIPAWEFQAMVSEYRQQLDVKLLVMNDPQKDLKICVCVRKRPITKKELNKKDIDVLTIPNKEVVIVHLPKVKVDLTKYIDNQKFRFDYGFHETCNNELVYHFTAHPLVQSLFQGNNPMVFAYGQTGS
ncbi:unnamed protein product, partial [Rotaria magnacalcarata]